MIRTVKGRMNHGPYKDFYESGAKRTVANYRNGKFDGLYTCLLYTSDAADE